MPCGFRFQDMLFENADVNFGIPKFSQSFKYPAHVLTWTCTFILRSCHYLWYDNMYHFIWFSGRQCWGVGGLTL